MAKIVMFIRDEMFSGEWERNKNFREIVKQFVPFMIEDPTYFETTANTPAGYKWVVDENPDCEIVITTENAYKTQYEFSKRDFWSSSGAVSPHRRKSFLSLSRWKMVSIPSLTMAFAHRFHPENRRKTSTLISLVNLPGTPSLICEGVPFFNGKSGGPVGLPLIPVTGPRQ